MSLGSSRPGPGPQARPLLTPEQIAVRAGEQVAFLRLVDLKTVFAEREARLRSLAPGHPIGDYLSFIADVAQAQHRVANRYPELVLPTAADLDAAARQASPPFRASRWPRQAVWIDGLRQLLTDLDSRLGAGPARDLIRQLRAETDRHLDSQADRILNGISLGLNIATAPLISAALQVHWSCLVEQTRARFGDAVFGRTTTNTACPCCGSAPTASITRLGGEQTGFRYLHCSLCSSQWHLVRVKCGHCESTKGISFQELQLDTPDTGPGSPSRLMPGNGPGARSATVKAECCGECGHYLKIVHMEKDPSVDPVADDLATISLDLLVTDTGMFPAGINLMLWYAEPDGDNG